MTRRTIKRSSWYSLEEVAQLFSLNPETVRRWQREGKIKAHFLGTGRLGGYRVDHAELIRVAKERYPHMELKFADDETGGE